MGSSTTTGFTRIATVVLALAVPGAAAIAQSGDSIELGKQVAFDRDKGNCLACHAIADGKLPGNIAPPLVGMKQRFPDRVALRAQIADASVRNPRTTMPPFGNNRILTDSEIDAIVDFLYTL